ncbi:hypothetical protein [Microlunatus sp. GCM10028923]|uniref:hypothetical protein n=1 Tax=Microlunatus sp. GCM10028923 TaxID=3273400 RepID=UPI00361DE120
MISTSTLLPVRRYRLAGLLGFALGTWYAVFVRFYQAAGGTIGLPDAPPPGLAWASYTAGLLILVGAVACLVLTQPSLRTGPAWSPVLAGRSLPRWFMISCCAVPTMIAAIFAIGHGAGGGFAKVLEAAGVGIASIRADDPRGSAAELTWQIAFYQPWFLAFGICMAVAAIGYLREAGVRPPTVRRVSTLVITLSLIISLYFVLAMMLHWNIVI